MTSCRVVRNAEGYVVTCSEEAEYPRVAHRDVTEYYCGIWTGGETIDMYPIRSWVARWM